MPQDLIRYQQTGGLHFLTFSCHHRRPHLLPPQARNCFERALESMRVRYGFFVTAYVVMPEHVHLLVSEPTHVPLATAIQALKLAVTVRQEHRPFWQKRYYDYNVRSESKVIEKRRYIHRNPVHRGLVTAPELWPWSSFNHWQSGKPGIVQIESPWTARTRSPLTENRHSEQSPAESPLAGCPTSRP